MKNFRLRGLKSLVHDAVSATTDLVGVGHDSTGRAVERVATAAGLGEPTALVNAARKLATDGVLLTVKAVNRAVEAASDAGIDAAEAIAGDQGPRRDDPVAMRADVMTTGPWMADALVGAVNGVVGDHLRTRRNPLDLGLSMRLPSRPAKRVAVFVHGLATTEWSWCLDADRLLGDPAANFGTLLERDTGLVPVFVRYNTGRHVSQSGRALADALERLVADWQVEELVLIGHSMGGLVARSATQQVGDGTWLGVVTRLVCIGSPHHGAPLERFGHALAGALHAVDLPGTRIPAAILRARSHGIKDLRHGHVADADWRDRDLDAPAAPVAPVDLPLLPGIAYAFYAGSATSDPDSAVSSVLGDLLVPVTSAEGGPLRGAGAVRTARFPGVRHHELQVHPAVYAALLQFCAEPQTAG